MELDAIIQESMEIMEKEFYANPFKFSYSSLNKLMWNPQAFYQTYVLGNREERTDAHLINGKIVHALLLEEAKFHDQFIVSPANIPTGSTKTVVDTVYRHARELQLNGDQKKDFVDFTDAVLDVLKDINLHQSLKTDQQRIDKIYTVEALNYWEFLKIRGNKTLIDQESYEFCKTAVDLIKQDKDLCHLIGCDVTDFDTREVFNEIQLECGINDKTFGLKGIIDNLVFDHDNKMIYINDIKTTSKDLKDFPETVEFYSYWMQAAVYSTIVAIKYINLIETGYQMKFHFVVIDRLYNVYPFHVSDNSMNNWFTKLTEVLDKADWHYQNRNYILPYEFAVGNVTL